MESKAPQTSDEPVGLIDRLSEDERARWIEWLATMLLAEAIREDEEERAADAARKAG